jgi:hypothetical protein
MSFRLLSAAKLSLVLALVSLASLAQTPGLEPRHEGASVPTVSFSMARPGAEPEHYSLAVESSGRAAYQSDGKASGAASGDPYAVKFIVSAQTRERIFDLAREANYFQGNFDYKKGNIANMGAKTLAFADGTRHFQTTYNWSQNHAIDQLTTIFQSISNAMEGGRKLAHLRRFDKLGLDQELKNLEDLARSGQLAEVQGIEPVLREIADDTAVVRVARQRAQRLLQMAGSPTAAK